MKKKRGFTLIELLAVIVILAVIAVIAVPIVLNTIEKSKKGAFEQSLNGVVRAVDLYKARIQMDEEFSECRYFSFGSDVTEVTVRDGKKYYPLKELSIKGKLPTEGEIKVCLDELLIDASDGTYSGRYENEELNITKGDLASSDLTTPIIDIFNITSTTDKIIVTVAAHSQSVGGIISNYYYKIDDGKYNKTTEQSYVFEKLNAGQEHTITVMVENKSGITTEESKKITTKSFGELTIDVEDSNDWTSSKNVTINGTTQEYKIEYKIRKYNEDTKEIEESEFIEYKGTFKLDTMATNDYPILIIARYNDNGSYSNEKTYTVVNIDTTSPTTTKPVVNVSTTKPTSEASVVIRQADVESGLNESTIEYGYSLDNVDYTWQVSSELKKLKAGTKYYVKTRVTNNVGKTIESQVTEYTPGELTTCSVEVPSGWATNKTVTILGTQTGAELQYQVGATNENGWNSIENEGTVKVEENTSVYCRLWDGTTAGATGTGIVEGIDNEDPSIPTSTIRYGSSTGEVRENSDSWSSQTLWWGEFNSTDNEGSGIDHYEYSSGCTKTKSGDLSTSGYLYQNGTTSTYCIRAVDKVGNESEWSSPYYFNVDTTSPSVSIKAVKAGTSTAVGSGSWSDTGLNFTLTKGTTGDSGYTIKYCKDTSNSCTPSTTATSGSAITGYNTTTGTYYIRYQITTGAGKSSAVGSYTAKVDTTTPTVKISAVKAGTTTAVGSGSWSNTGLNFTLTKDKTGDSGYTIKYCKDTSNSCTPSTTATSGSAITGYNTTTGTYYIRYQITTGAGKSSEVGSYTAKVDTTTPTVKISAVKAGTSTAVGSGSWSNTGLNFTLTKDKTGDSGYTIKYCKDTSNSCTPSTTATSGSAITGYNTTTGTYYIRYQITTGAGKSSGVGYYTVKVDTTPPTCGTITGASTTWTNSTREISVKCTDSGGSECTSTSFTSKFSTDTKVGYITIKDTAGNTKSCSVNAYVDKTAPTTNSFSISPGGYSSWRSECDQNRNLTWVVTDSGSGVDTSNGQAYMYWAYLNASGSPISGYPGEGYDSDSSVTVSGSTYTVKSSYRGSSKTLRIRIYDKAKNYIEKDITLYTYCDSDPRFTYGIVSK